jgi:hypothetical protein
MMTLLASLPAARGQWLTQSFNLKQGWNAVYLHVDASHETLDNLVGSGAVDPALANILQIWEWNPRPSTMQFTQTPQLPVDTGSQWLSWQRSSSGSATLQRLRGNAACLVYAANDYTWTLKGRPVIPRYQWTTSGLNFLGFPTPPANPPSLEDFLAQVPEFQQSAEIYQYPGGDLGPGNPARVFAFRTTPATRGQAFWIRTGELFNRYYGPFELVSRGSDGMNFGDTLSAQSVRLRNLTAGPLTVTLRLVASESPPAGQSAIAGVPPLLVRGDLNTTSLTYDHSNLPADATHAWTLAARGQSGSEVEVVLGLNRYAITASPGELLAGVLRFTDSLGHSQVDVPVSGVVSSGAGLWVGGAMVAQVGQYLKSYVRDSDDKPVAGADGQYEVSAINTNLTTVPRFYPLRFIVHNPANSAGSGAVLLQRVFLGMNAFTNAIVASRESALGGAFLSQARRISAAHLPWSESNSGWPFSGKLGAGVTVTVSVTNDFSDHASNPFLHTYHPDHDNQDATFRNTLSQGSESYSIIRDITFAVTAPAADFDSLTASGNKLTGDYAESIRLVGLARAGGVYDTRQFEVRGVFSLNRITDVPVLTSSP